MFQICLVSVSKSRIFALTVALSILSKKGIRSLIVGVSFMSSVCIAWRSKLFTHSSLLRCKRKLRKFGFGTTSQLSTPCYGMQDYLQHFGLTLWHILSIALIALRVIILVVLYRLGSFSLGSVRAGISSACLVVMSLSIFRIMPLQKCQVSLRGGS